MNVFICLPSDPASTITSSCLTPVSKPTLMNLPASSSSLFLFRGCKSTHTFLNLQIYFKKNKDFFNSYSLFSITHSKNGTAKIIRVFVPAKFILMFLAKINSQ